MLTFGLEMYCHEVICIKWWGRYLATQTPRSPYAGQVTEWSPVAFVCIRFDFWARWRPYGTETTRETFLYPALNYGNEIQNPAHVSTNWCALRNVHTRTGPEGSIHLRAWLTQRGLTAAVPARSTLGPSRRRPGSSPSSMIGLGRGG